MRQRFYMSTQDLLATVTKTWEASQGSSVAVALSGGVDSMLLAEALYRLQLPFIALHVNHGWRGQESERDAVWVKKWCQEKKISFHFKKLSSKLPQTEAAGRQARLTFFAETAGKNGISEVWLAHHADDLAETFLLQLLRGAGPEGLSSLQTRKSLEPLTLVRPLLPFRKTELVSFAKAWKLEWREDASNQSDDYLRNRVRGKLIPYLKKLTGRDPLNTLTRSAQILRDENIYWESVLPKNLASTLNCALLRDQPVAWQRRLVRQWLLAQEVSNLSFDDVEAVRGLVITDKPAKINLSKGFFCRRRQGSLFIEKPKYP